MVLAEICGGDDTVCGHTFRRRVIISKTTVFLNGITVFLTLSSFICKVIFFILI